MPRHLKFCDADELFQVEETLEPQKLTGMVLSAGGNTEAHCN